MRLWQQLPLLGGGVSLALAGHQLGGLGLQAEAADRMLDERGFSPPSLGGEAGKAEKEKTVINSENSAHTFIACKGPAYAQDTPAPRLNSLCVPFIRGLFRTQALSRASQCTLVL